MSDPARKGMTSDEFIAWAMAQPETQHYELIGGEVVATAPERVAHVRTKAHIWRRLTEAIEVGNLPCEALVDGASVEVDDHTVYEPDVLVRCGPLLAPSAIKLSDTRIVRDDPILLDPPGITLTDCFPPGAA